MRRLFLACWIILFSAGALLAVFPTTGLIDNFNRADQNPLADGWTNRVRTGAVDLRILSNQVAANAGSHASAYRTTAVGPDSEAYVIIATKAANDGHVGVWARLQTPGTTGTADGYVFAGFTRAGTDEWQLFRMDNDALTQLGATVTEEIVAGDSVGIEIIGTTIRGMRKTSGAWEEQLSVTDATYTESGNIGLDLSETTSRGDDFSGGTVVAGAAFPSAILNNPLMY